MISFAAERLMELEVGALRLPDRSGPYPRSPY
jgi:hypothetical protein